LDKEHRNVIFHATTLFFFKLIVNAAISSCNRTLQCNLISLIQCKISYLKQFTV